MALKHAFLCLSLVSFTSMHALSHNNKDSCPPGPRTSRVTVRHIEGKGIGYKEGYTTLEGFFAPKRYTEFLPFLDLRGHVFDNGNWAANAGGGLRYLPTVNNTIFGINAYYDYRRNRGHNFNQVSVGLEALERVWEFRINGYLPVGKKLSDSFSKQFSNFQGNSIYLNSKREFALKGLDAEAGGHFYRKKNVDLYGGVGPYAFKGHYGKTAVGGKARITARALDYFMVEVSGSYDQVYHGIVQGQFGITVPFGPKMPSRHPYDRYYAFCDDEYELEERWAQPVVRQEIVVLDRHTSKQIAINPATGLPYNVIFVNNLSSSNGTFESPYSTLATAQSASKPYDIVYIFAGDGTVRGLDTGFTLQAGQKLLGSGISHPLATTAGTITLPALTSQLPLISNAEFSNTIILLATQTEIAGLRIHDLPLPSVNNCISGPGAFENVVIRNNIMQPNQGNSIDITATEGDITQSLSITDNVFAGTYGTGIQMIANLPNIVQNFTISGNHMMSFTSVGVAIVAQGANCVSTGQITNNTLIGFTGTGAGAYGTILGVQNPQSTQNITFSGNIVQNCDSGGFNISNVNAASTIVVDSNQFLGNNNNVASGAFVYIGNDTQNFTFTNNLVSAYTAFTNELLVSGGPSPVTLDFSNNVFNSTDESAVNVAMSAGTSPPTPFVCMRLNNNTTNVSSVTPTTSYLLTSDNANSIFDLETPVGNVGTISTTNVTIVPAGTCSPIK